jgi:hypothetical protein
MQLLSTPWVDKTSAIVAITPNVIELLPPLHRRQSQFCTCGGGHPDNHPRYHDGVPPHAGASDAQPVVLASGVCCDIWVDCFLCLCGGPYRFVRHPIYTGLFVTLFAFLLRAYLPLNLLLVAVIAGLFMLKSVIEGRFLRDNPDYAAYMKQVRFRWIPGVA